MKNLKKNLKNSKAAVSTKEQLQKLTIFQALDILS